MASISCSSLDGLPLTQAGGLTGIIRLVMPSESGASVSMPPAAHGRARMPVACRWRRPELEPGDHGFQACVSCVSVLASAKTPAYSWDRPTLRRGAQHCASSVLFSAVREMEGRRPVARWCASAACEPHTASVARAVVRSSGRTSRWRSPGAMASPGRAKAPHCGALRCAEEDSNLHPGSRQGPQPGVSPGRDVPSFRRSRIHRDLRKYRRARAAAEIPRRFSQCFSRLGLPIWLRRQSRARN